MLISYMKSAGKFCPDMFYEREKTLTHDPALNTPEKKTIYYARTL